VVFNEESIFNGRIKDLMDNLMHSTLQEIATHVRTIELPTPTQQPQTDSFYEDEATAELSGEQDEANPPGYY
jgi:hypothetical protein